MTGTSIRATGSVNSQRAVRMPNPHRNRTIAAKQKEIAKNTGWTKDEIGHLAFGTASSAAGAAIMIGTEGIASAAGAVFAIEGTTEFYKGYKSHHDRKQKATQLQQEIDKLRKTS